MPSRIGGAGTKTGVLQSIVTEIYPRSLLSPT